MTIQEQALLTVVLAATYRTALVAMNLYLGYLLQMGRLTKRNALAIVGSSFIATGILAWLLISAEVLPVLVILFSLLLSVITVLPDLGLLWLFERLWGGNLLEERTRNLPSRLVLWLGVALGLYVIPIALIVSESTAWPLVIAAIVVSYASGVLLMRLILELRRLQWQTNPTA